MIDTRERDIFPALDRHIAYSGHCSEVQQMARGDYAVVRGDTVLAVIERKTLVDLAASIKDGRLENLEGLIEMREECRCQVWLLVEGRPFNAPDRKIGRIPWGTLESCILDVSIRRGIFVVWTRDGDDTASKLCKLMGRYMRADELADRADAALGGVGALGRKRVVSDAEYVAKMWACVSGITAQVGFEFAKLGSFARLRQMSDDALRVALESVRHASGRRLPKTAVDIAYGLVRGTSPRGIDRRVYACVPRISAAMAGLLSAEFHAAELMLLSRASLEALKPAGAKKKLGKSGEKLFDLLSLEIVPAADAGAGAAAEAAGPAADSDSDDSSDGESDSDSDSGSDSDA